MSVPETMDRKESRYDLRDPSRAPEVAHSYSPIPVVRDSEGLQLGYEYTNGKEAVADEQSWGPDEQAAHYGDAAIQQRRWYRRKRWIAAIVLAFLAIVAVAVGAGVGASHIRGTGSSGEEQMPSEGQDSSER